MAEILFVLVPKLLCAVLCFWRFGLCFDVAERESAQHLRSWRRLTGHHIPFTFNDVEQFALFYIALWACGKLAEALWLPSLAGELLCGMVLGPRLSSFVPKPDAVMMIGQVGLVLEMVDLDMLVAYGPRLATAVGLSAEAAYVVAIAAMPTAVGVATKVMNMGHVLNTPLGQLVLLAAERTGQLVLLATVVDDIIAFINLGELKALADPCAAPRGRVLSSVLLLAGVGWLAVDVVPRLVESKLLPRVQQRHHDVVLTSLLCAMAVGLMAVCHRTKTFPLLGAFLAGLSFCSIAPVHHVWAHQVKRIQYSLLRLFYGATIAFEVPVATMWTGRIIGRGALFFLAIAGKPPPLPPLLRQIHLAPLVGAGEISLLAGFQGLVDNAIDEDHRLMRVDNVIDEDTFGSIVFAVLLSVFVGPWALRWRLWHDRKADRARNWAIEKELAVEDEEGGGDTRYPHFVYYTLDISCAAKFGLLSKLVNVAVEHDLEVIDFRVHGAHVKGGHDVVYEFYLKDALLLAHIDDAYRERSGTAMSTPTPTTLDVLDTARERAHSFLGLGHNGRPPPCPRAHCSNGPLTRAACFLVCIGRPASFPEPSPNGRHAALMLDRVHSRVSRARAHAAIGHPSPSATQLALTSGCSEEEGKAEGAAGGAAAAGQTRASRDCEGSRGVASAGSAASAAASAAGVVRKSLGALWAARHTVARAPAPDGKPHVISDEEIATRISDLRAAFLTQLGHDPRACSDAAGGGPAHPENDDEMAERFAEHVLHRVRFDPAGQHGYAEEHLDLERRSPSLHASPPSILLSESQGSGLGEPTRSPQHPPQQSSFVARARRASRDMFNILPPRASRAGDWTADA
ncbi:hypothetical protein EMIHUDRAFT_212309 [Emiliania huxleyi CCMP1516]|uniref:Cation/H+ exchanger domain-containing protein n=2 Tax=Emiliania huxleyi TaxID=2903 RepID=A0A0D3IRB8_EMIH1|nr:hypothetical protein EMIHUDRAFT_212309 [Emiliania huxleyi CCMP1516]EOD13803.1 hypothetical protein EMIHUDRAFT_212309 [Emiliania huxleyi CCMP1516]|eukprot:XP_005766232.1 hypothetical protein EMIHUDRAFT_212309 [Emiliania huxleyi CCMP1516]